jgi:hypothetical protein
MIMLTDVQDEINAQTQLQIFENNMLHSLDTLCVFQDDNVQNCMGYNDWQQYKYYKMS